MNNETDERGACRRRRGGGGEGGGGRRRIGRIGEDKTDIEAEEERWGDKTTEGGRGGGGGGGRGGKI